MNILKGNINSLNTSGRLTIVTLDVSGFSLKSIIIENPETVTYLRIGNPIQVMFKETEVVVGKGSDIAVSLDNRIDGVITEITKGVLLSSLIIDTKAGKIKATLTSESVTKLDLQPGEPVTALVKTTEIMLSE
ncbi:MAG: TOBE domain-containing protein [Bacteroidales bacterium]|nr:TOBE domain-containing protein [Bacteroidales bacterium]